MSWIFQDSLSFPGFETVKWVTGRALGLHNLAPAISKGFYLEDLDDPGPIRSDIRKIGRLNDEKVV